MSLHLRKNEKLVLRVDIHWSNFIFSGIWAFFGLLTILGVVFSPKEQGTIGMAIAMVAVIFWGPLIYKILSNKCKTYAVTDQRFYVEEGILSKTKLDIPFIKLMIFK